MIVSGFQVKIEVKSDKADFHTLCSSSVIFLYPALKTEITRFFYEISLV